MDKNKVFSVRTGMMVGEMTLYGSNSCGWTTKQKDALDKHGIKYNYVDCSAQGANCPDIVKGFPTIVWNGYMDIFGDEKAVASNNPILA